ncbi:unnamed protein product [Rotaria sp. Silwood1]|nr:unnamed protein product [Rotaria sp. Silwood1]
MSKTQVKLYELWSKNKNGVLISISEHGRSSSSVEPQRDRDSSLFVVEPECGSSSSVLAEPQHGSSSSVLAEPQHGSSSSSVAPQQNSSLFLLEPERGSSSSSVEPEHGSSSSSSVEPERGSLSSSITISLSSSSTTLSANPDCEIISEGVKKRALPSARTQHRSQYLHEWEKKPEAHFKTYIYDDFGGKENVWFNSGMKTLSIDKIKQHKEKSEVHKQAEEQEILLSSRVQPNWHITREKEVGKHEQAIQHLMFACIYLCQEDHPLASIEPLCVLLEKLGVQLLPAQVSGVSYRNSHAAMGFIQHIANFLHEELVEKIQLSPVLGWMMDETTTRTIEKSCIVFVRYVDNFEPKTAYFGLMNLEGDGTAANIVKSISSLWRKDDINPLKSCWLATDNASTFTGVREGVLAKIRRNFGCDWLELNPCFAHSFSLVGSYASYKPKTDPNSPPAVDETILNLEAIISRIYGYFSRSSTRLFKLKQWQNYLDLPEMKFKKLFEIRWSTIQDCIRPIIINVLPGSQSLLAYLQEAATDVTLSSSERESAKNLLKSILNDDFLLALHFHYDLHETVLGPLTKIMQNDKLSYYSLMEMLQEKTKILESWTCESSSTVGPALFDYLQSTAEESFGSFRVTVGDRKMLLNNCLEHIHRLLRELDKRFTPSKLQECLSILFDPQYLIKNKRNISCLDYGRSELDFLRRKYNKFPNFDSNVVRNEWESLKQPLSDFANTFSTVQSTQTFWKDFIALKISTNSNFLSQHKNILLLLNIYLISPTNSAECERGFSAANRIQATGRSRLKISTLDILMTIRMLLKDDLRSSRCQEVVNKSFESWNDLDHNRRLHQIQLLLDTPDDYTPANQVRSVCKRNRDYLQSEFIENKKKKKSKYIKCANGCKREVSGTDPSQNEAILCCHQNEQFQWIDLEENCSRWLCNYCRIKLAIAVDSAWFCDDHVDMHHEEDENENFD